MVIIITVVGKELWILNSETPSSFVPMFRGGGAVAEYAGVIPSVMLFYFTRSLFIITRFLYC